MHRIKKYLAVLFTALVIIGGFTPKILADRVEIAPMFTYGESLTTEQFNKTKQLLGVASGTKEIEVHINELNQLLQDSYPYSQVYSSTYITPAKNNGGVTVEILTPDTITSITQAQYENAAVTAGAVDVDIKVASAVKVDGSGALAGVYKAFQSQGVALDANAVSVAQQELQTTSTISNENKSKEGFNDDTLNAAIADMKKQIQDYKDKNGGSIDNNQIQIIINNVINNYNLGNILSKENIDQLNNLMQRFSSIELSDAQKDALNQLGQNLIEKGSEALDNIKSSWNNLDQEKKDGIINSVTTFFTNIWEAIVNFVNSIIALFK